MLAEAESNSGDETDDGFGSPSPNPHEIGFGVAGPSTQRSHRVTSRTLRSNSGKLSMIAGQQSEHEDDVISISSDEGKC